MKRIDLHTKDILQDGELRYNNSISSESMKEYIFNKIDFNISEYQWNIIEEHFADYWNNKIGIGGYFYHDEIVSSVYEKVIDKKQLISRERIEFIVESMLTKIEKDEGTCRAAQKSKDLGKGAGNSGRDDFYKLTGSNA